MKELITNTFKENEKRSLQHGWLIVDKREKTKCASNVDTVGFTTLDVVSLGWCCKNWLVIANKNFTFCNGMHTT